ncbi:enoyl-CoA hydratase family protein [Streptomyces sp. PTM05]|uniref:Enoyl-CoA hydratase family protein n=1 Tax=Streptantibioticus parmotrematis TaxID=2873249 RepID=A0ABS7QWM2_9ACTN|nr:enoyl-CoA hydratase family protein [Streptantibioticus parmotrematis]MBY8887604.1 enoyl-CoA hydratase family protein [Streptantibioticus parmotrematis]
MTDPAAPVRVSHDRGIAVVTLDSPHNRNALSSALVSGVRAALDEAAGAPGTRAVLLTHTGNTFCAGADLTERHPTGPAELTALLRALVESPKPVVGRTTGHVRAGGLGLLAACDIAVAGPRATFAFTEARLGLAPSVISLTVLPRMRPRDAERYYLTGEVFDADQAVRTGLVSAGDEALDGILDGLRAASPQGLAESKRLTGAAVLRSFDRDARVLAEQSARLFASAEAAEGVRAFLERREAPWAL